MPAAARKYHLRFEEGTLSFSESYPTGLETVLPVSEFDAVVRKINNDMAQEIHKRADDLRLWASIWLGFCVVAVGLFITPVVFVKSSRQRREQKRFWDRVRAYLAEINRKTYYKRNLEWKLTEDRRKLRGRDVVNPMLAHRIEIIHRLPKTRPRSGRVSMVMTAVAAGATREPGHTGMMDSFLLSSGTTRTTTTTPTTPVGITSTSTSITSTSPETSREGLLREEREESEREEQVEKEDKRKEKEEEEVEEEEEEEEEDEIQGEEIQVEDFGMMDEGFILEEDEENAEEGGDELDFAASTFGLSSVGEGSQSRGSQIQTGSHSETDGDPSGRRRSRVHFSELISD